MDAHIIKKYGIDYDSGVRRFMGDVELYETVLTAFLKDKILDYARAAYQEKEYEKLFALAHEIKGSSSNADMYELYAASCILVELLRNGEYDEEKITQAFINFETAYNRARTGIISAQGGDPL
ncbi:MAG: Hpt domain-containing protein [Oscillospiraceae bacterium]|nr:Hpt domain-containing protein [Oscillospiraceae bacterium]